MHMTITKVTQNKAGMHTKESPHQTFEITNNNYDTRYDRVYQNHDCQTKYFRPDRAISYIFIWYTCYHQFSEFICDASTRNEFFIQNYAKIDIWIIELNLAGISPHFKSTIVDVTILKIRICA